MKNFWGYCNLLSIINIIKLCNKIEVRSNVRCRILEPIVLRNEHRPNFCEVNLNALDVTWKFRNFWE